MPRKKARPARPRLQRVSIRAERRAEPDWDRFAWALLQHAKNLRAQEEDEAQPAEPDGTSRPQGAENDGS